MPDPIERILAKKLSRRRLLCALGGAGGTATLLALPACSYFAPESCGQAYDPWQFPADEQRPEYLAVGAAILAASPHNTQPWKFEIDASRIELHADLEKSLGAMDGLHREMYIGLGCALENLTLAARQHGRTPSVTLLPDADDETHVASVELVLAAPEAQRLYASIPQRHTNRGRYLDEAAPGLESALRALVAEPGVELTFLASAAEKSQFRQATIEATRAIVGDQAMNDASHDWWRQNCEDIERHRDGLTMDATGQGATTRFLGKSLAAPDAERAGDYWLSLTEGDQTTASAFVILSTADRYERAEQLVVGRVFQRLHLWAVSVGLAIQPLNQLAERQDREDALGLDPHFTSVLNELLGPDRGAQMLFRIGYAWDHAYASPRRPIDWVTL